MGVYARVGKGVSNFCEVTLEGERAKQFSFRSEICSLSHPP
jgi:hypothetical protein